MSISIASLAFSNARETLQTGMDAIKNGRYIFDLGDITTTDSSSIAVMLAWQRTAKAASKELHFINTPDSILSLASLYGVTDILGLGSQASIPPQASH